MGTRTRTCHGTPSIPTRLNGQARSEESTSDQIRASALDVMADMRSVPNEDTPRHVARTSNGQASGEEASTSYQTSASALDTLGRGRSVPEEDKHVVPLRAGRRGISMPDDDICTGEEARSTYDQIRASALNFVRTQLMARLPQDEGAIDWVGPAAGGGRALWDALQSASFFHSFLSLSLFFSNEFCRSSFFNVRNNK